MIRWLKSERTKGQDSTSNSSVKSAQVVELLAIWRKYEMAIVRKRLISLAHSPSDCGLTQWDAFVLASQLDSVPLAKAASRAVSRSEFHVEGGMSWKSASAVSPRYLLGFMYAVNNAWSTTQPLEPGSWAAFLERDKPFSMDSVASRFRVPDDAM